MAHVKKLAIILPLFFLVVLLFWYAASFNGKDVASYLGKWNVSMNAVDFALVDFQESNSSGLAKEFLEAESSFSGVGEEQVILKMTRTKAIAPQKYLDDKKFLLESLFLPTTSPYPGVITNVRECPEEFKPQAQETEQGTIYTLFAGARFNYGVCAQDLVEYYSAYGIFDCKEKGIFEVRAFSKKENESKALIQSFDCE